MNFYDLFIIKIAKNRVYLPQDRRADVAREVDMGAQDQRGCDVALRLRGRAAHGPREGQVARRWHVWRGHVAGGHAGLHGSTRTPMRGATWRGGWGVKGPRG